MSRPPKVADMPLSAKVADLIATALGLHFDEEAATLCDCALDNNEAREVRELIDFLSESQRLPRVLPLETGALGTPDR